MRNIKTVKEWKKTSLHQFEFASSYVLIRLIDKEPFVLNETYVADGYTAGTVIILDDANLDMIHVNYDLFSSIGKFIGGGKVQINDIVKHASGGIIYLYIKQSEVQRG